MPRDGASSADVLVVVEAVRLPTAALAEEAHSPCVYTAEWSFGSTAGGASEGIRPNGPELSFDLRGHFSVPLNGAQATSPLLVYVFATPRSGQPRLIGTSTVHVHDHLPRPHQPLLRQRATLYMERSPYAPPPMIRLLLESRSSEQVAPQQPAAMGRQAPPSTTGSAKMAAKDGRDGVEAAKRRVAERRAKERRRSEDEAQVARVPTPRGSGLSSAPSATQPPPKHEPPLAALYPRAHVDPHHHADPFFHSPRHEVAVTDPLSPVPVAPAAHTAAPEGRADLRSPSIAGEVLHALSDANERLREDNDRLKRALEQRILGTLASPSPARHVERATSAMSTREPSIGTALTMVEELAAARAEASRLQRAATAHDEELAAKDATVRALRSDLQAANDATGRLRQELAAMQASAEADAKETQGATSEIHSLQEKLLSAERHNRELHQHRSRLEELLSEARARGLAAEERAHQAEAQQQAAESHAATVLKDSAEKVERYEASLRLGQQELQRMHQYGSDLNKRCQELAAVVTSQQAVLEKRREKVLELRGMLAAQEKIQRVAAEDASAPRRRALTSGPTPLQDVSHMLQNYGYSPAPAPLPRAHQPASCRQRTFDMSAVSASSPPTPQGRSGHRQRSLPQHDPDL